MFSAIGAGHPVSNGNAAGLDPGRLPGHSSVLVTLRLQPGSGASIVGPASAAPTAALGRYTILRTLDVDEYETAVPAADVMALAAPRPPPTDNAFRGTARKAAKLSVADAETESFDDLRDLIGTLEEHDLMVDHPDMSPDAANNRVEEEKRNVRVDAFLYAASWEDDNDYHLIIGRNPASPKST